MSVKAVPGQQNTVQLENGEFTTPTRLSESTWENLLAGQVPATNVSVTANNLTVQTSGSVDIACAPVGVNEAPDGGERAPEALGINPTDNVQIRAFSRPSNDVVEVTFNNTASQDINATEIRLPFYHNPSDQGGDIGPIEVIDPDTGNTAATLDVLGDFNTLDPKITFPGNQTETTVTFRNTGGEKFDGRDFFILEITFSNGQTGTYFVDVPA